MKKNTHNFILFILLFSVANIIASIKVDLEPNVLFKGEKGQLKIISDSGPGEITSLPKIAGIRWIGQPSTSRSIQIINWKKTSKDTTTYYFVAEKKGQLRIPSMIVKAGGKRSRTRPLILTVKERKYKGNNGQTLTMNDLIFAELDFPGYNKKTPKKLYPGQELDLKITINVAEKLKLKSLGYPHSELKNTILKDFSRYNHENKNFLRPQQKRLIKNEIPYSSIEFNTTITPLSVEKLAGYFIVECQLYSTSENSNSRGSRNPFFDDFFNRRRTVTKTVKIPFPPINVSKLPDFPKTRDSFFLGLLGKWDISLSLSSSKVKAGEPVSMTLKARGNGNIGSLTPPELKLPGFRIYEPEISKKGNHSVSEAKVSWAVIPLEENSILPLLKFSFFNSKTEEYVERRFKLPLQVLPGEKVSAKVAITNSRTSTINNSQEEIRSNDILYIKKNIGTKVKLPLNKNIPFWIILLSIISPVFYLLCFWLQGKKNKLMTDTSYRRKQEALKNKKTIIKKLRKAPKEDIPDIIQKELVPCLNALLGCPPGTTSTALMEKIEKLDDSILKETLQQTEMSGFSGTKDCSINIKSLTKSISRISILLLGLFLMQFTIPNLIAQEKKISIISEKELFKEANTFYDKGKLQESLNIYLKLLKKDKHNPSSNLLYNIANCKYRQNNLPKALLYYEKAMRLNPTDTDIKENLNFIRNQLGLKPVYPANSPAKLLRKLRDQLRPDAWINILLLIWSTFWIYIGIFVLKNKRTGYIPITVVVILIATCIISLIFQTTSTYRKNANAVICAKDTTAYRLPSNKSAKTDFVLSTGLIIDILEERSEWTRIRIDEAEGWVKNEKFKKIW